MLAASTHQLLSSELEVVQVVEAGSADHHRHLQLGLRPRLQPQHAVWKPGNMNITKNFLFHSLQYIC